MATPRMDITSFVGKLLEEDDVDLLREGVRVLAQALLGAVAAQPGVGRGPGLEGGAGYLTSGSCLVGPPKKQ
jgi:hypothetical protein